MNASIESLSGYFQINAFGRPSRMKDPMFRSEKFYTSCGVDHLVPSCEILLNHPDCEDFFQGVRGRRESLQTDLFLFGKALDYANDQDDAIGSFSFNIDLSSALDPSFAARASLICSARGFFDRTKIFFEITEHAEIPEGARVNVLRNFKAQGFKLAIDDFNPYIPEQVERLEKLAPYADIIKFDHAMIEKCARERGEDVYDTISRFRELYPDQLFVQEGMTSEMIENRPDYLKKLANAGIDLFQHYVPQKERRDFDHQQEFSSANLELVARKLACV